MIAAVLIQVVNCILQLNYLIGFSDWLFCHGQMYRTVFDVLCDGCAGSFVQSFK